MLVFDSSTLILLAKSDMLSLLLDSYPGDVLIPEEVERECCDAGPFPDAIVIKSWIQSGRIKVVRISDCELPSKLIEDFRINMGEAESLTLAVERSADIVATDDKNAILACKLLKIKFTTALGILVRLAEKKAIGLDDALVKLEKLALLGRYDVSIIEDTSELLRGMKWQKHKKP